MMKNITTLIPFALLLITTDAMADSTTSYAGIQKQLSIMSDIIKSSANVQEGRKSSKINNIDAMYLKDQGVVFTISSGSSSKGWGSYHFNFSAPIAPPIPPSAPSTFSVNEAKKFEREVEIEMNEAMSNAYEEVGRVMGDMENHHEQYRDIIDEQRDVSYELRDIQRELRDLSFQAKRADKEDKKRLEKRIKEHEKEKEILTEKNKAFEKEVAKIRVMQNNARKEQEKEREIFYKGLNYSLAETLCLYGNGLRDLPSKERISVIIKAGGEKFGRGYKDQIFVYNKQDISDCSINKITVDKLLTKGNGYQF